MSVTGRCGSLSVKLFDVSARSGPVVHDAVLLCQFLDQVRGDGTEIPGACPGIYPYPEAVTGLASVVPVYRWRGIVTDRSDRAGYRRCRTGA